DEDGEHDAMVLDWGAYEFMRKQEHWSDLWNAYRMGRDRDVLLLVGNMNRHRTSFVVIAILTFAKQEQMSLLG
ncbi:unnamed protein product, partial [marine sediment metagenome]